ncbi:MAG: glucose-1-phosphate adenylyltransferase [Saprospiraceae bacterium]
MANMISIILGGGAGSRLFPLTEKRSKPAVPIGGKYRLIDIPISNCINSGVKRMYVVTQYNSASLNAHIKNTYNFDTFSSGFVDILAAEQTPGNKEWFQGTADAVRQSRQHYERQDFDLMLILSGDQLYQMDFCEMAAAHEKAGADITIACLPVDARDATGFGIMKVDQHGYIPRFVEKPHADLLPNWASEVSNSHKKAGRHYMASMGIYIFSRQVLSDMFDQYPDATDFGKEIIPAAIESGLKVAAYNYEGYWTDIGTIRSFFDANIELTDHIPSFNLFSHNQRIYTRGRMLPPAKFYGGTQLNRALIAEGSIIHARIIEGSIVGLRSRIGENTVIKDAIIMGNDSYQTLEEIANSTDQVPMGVGHNCHIEHAILDKDCRIGNNVVIKGSDKLPDMDTENYCIRDGVVVVRKGGVIEEGMRIM